MKFAALRWFVLAGSALVPNFSCQCASPIDGALPDASQVMQRVILRGEDEGRTPQANEYAFEKRIVNEELDASGTPTKSTEQTSEVIPIQGIPFSRLVKIQNRDLTEEETEAQNQKELEFRKKVARRGAEPMSRRKKNWLDTRVLDRFNFKVEGRDTFQNRPVLILSFHPKTNRDPEKTITDKVLNRLAGILWVDEAEAEVAQLKVSLTEDLSLGWFGAVGSLKQFDLELQRERLPDGVWVTRKQIVVLCGRKIFSSMAHRTLEESSNFRKPGIKLTWPVRKRARNPL
jgi:hypothetical protein